MKVLKVLQRIGELLRPPRKRTGYLSDPSTWESTVDQQPGADNGARYSPVRYRL